MMSRSALAAVALVGLAALPAAAEPYASAYTRHDFSACAERPSPHPDEVEVRRCQGLGSVAFTWTNEPDSSAIAFGEAAPDGPIPGLEAIHAVRSTIEWRGPSTNGRLAPVAAIARYDTGPSIRLGASRLVIYRLTRGGACVMGVVDGARTDANAAVRALVDRYAAGFACGRSRILRDP